MLEWSWWMPRRTERLLTAQGLKGTPLWGSQEEHQPQQRSKFQACAEKFPQHHPQCFSLVNEQGKNILSIPFSALSSNFNYVLIVG